MRITIKFLSALLAGALGTTAVVALVYFAGTLTLAVTGSPLLAIAGEVVLGAAVLIEQAFIAARY